MNNIRLSFKTQYGWDFVQLVILPNGTKLAIKGTTGAGYGIDTNYDVEVKRKADLVDLVNRLVRFEGYILKDNYKDREELSRLNVLVNQK